MHPPGSQSRQTQSLQVCTLRHRLRADGGHPTAARPLVLPPPLRFPKLKRIFYFDYCSVAAATHVAVVNYDEELSLCEIVDDTVFFNETQGVPCKVFSNRYMKYIIKEGELVEAQLFDLKTRTRNIMSQQKQGLSNQQV
jgi:hypothetical protein